MKQISKIHDISGHEIQDGDLFVNFVRSDPEVRKELLRKDVKFAVTTIRSRTFQGSTFKLWLDVNEHKWTRFFRG